MSHSNIDTVMMVVPLRGYTTLLQTNWITTTRNSEGMLLGLVSIFHESNWICLKTGIVMGDKPSQGSHIHRKERPDRLNFHGKLILIFDLILPF